MHSSPCWSILQAGLWCRGGVKRRSAWRALLRFFFNPQARRTDNAGRDKERQRGRRAHPDTGHISPATRRCGKSFPRATYLHWQRPQNVLQSALDFSQDFFVENASLSLGLFSFSFFWLHYFCTYFPKRAEVLFQYFFFLSFLPF